MTTAWAQTLTLVAAILVAVLSGVVYNNRRIDDLRADMNARFTSLEGTINARFGEVNASLRELRDALRVVRP
jgi:hypothetical protein